MLVRLFKIIGALALTAALGACSSALPHDGPYDERVVKQALAYKVAPRDPAVSYFLADLSSDVVQFFDTPSKRVAARSFGVRSAGPSDRIGQGDVLAVSVFESGAGGLFVPAEAGSRPGNFVTLPQQTVDSSGSIKVPYAGIIRAAGRTTSQVQGSIEAALADRALEPQVVVTIVEGRSAEVSVLGDVNSSTQFSVQGERVTVLDAIARAGGISTPPPETFVTLQRNGRSSTLRFDRLLTSPSENVLVTAGDVVFVERDRRTYLAFGATGEQGRFTFEESDLTLADAVGKAGGLLDARAEPRSVFIYRHVDWEIARHLGFDVSVKTDGHPVILRLNLRDPSGYFIAKKFRMRDGDIIYVDNAETVKVSKVFSIIQSGVSTTLGTAVTARALTN